MGWLARESVNNPQMTNSVSMSAALGVTGYDIGLLDDAMKGQFAASGTDVIQANIRAAHAGYSYATSELTTRPEQQLKPRGKSERLLLTGNEAASTGPC